MKSWYCEFKDGVRIHDYFNIMINNFPILTWRRFDFGVHSGIGVASVHCIAILGVDIFKRVK